MHAAKRLFLSLAPTMVAESLPLILVTTVYELDILRYLFFGHPTRPIPPSRRKLDSIAFLPIPEKAQSWQGKLVAFVCGLVWFFSEFTLDTVLIILGVDSTADVEKKVKQHKQHQEQEPVVEEHTEEVKTKKVRHYHHHHHHHHHHDIDIYEAVEASFGEHQPQQQHGGVERNWRRESRREGGGAYGGGEGEGDNVVEQLDLQDDLLAWSSMKRSVEFEQECEALFAVSAALKAAEEEEQEEEKGAVLSSPVATVGAEKDMQGNDTPHPIAEFSLLPAQDPECKVSVTIYADMNADDAADAEVDTEAADEPVSASSSPLSSSSTACANLHSDTELNEDQGQEQTKDDFTDNTKAWVQLSVSTKAEEAPTENDCRTTADVHYFRHNLQLQHGDDQVSGVAIRTCDSVEQSLDQWSEWGPDHLSRAVKTVRSTQQQQQEQRAVANSPSGDRHLALFPPLSPLAAAESVVELLSDDERCKEARKKALRYGKKKKAAKKARKASGMPLSGSEGAGSSGEVDRLSA
ncbi:hypothetical protein BGW39_006773 [Mortierella sp. 14UC]|nr:hypothetical protein BGW39_006773 [Mortierella sp. 14UC]